uniref:RNA-dependent RNA polymerase n=1 Tax=Gongylonema pulchrum TaxID=637853 RepID=A0A183D4I9_9BILA
LLGFDDRDAVLQFLEYYGVRRINDPDTDEELMLISKTKLIEPVEEPLRRVHSWIESKRNGQTLTKILSGGSDVDVVISTPTNSFDKRGAYVSDAVLDSYISASGTDFTMATNENEVVSHAFTLFSKANRAANESIDTLAENLAAEIINAEVGRICKLIYSKSLAHPLTTTLFNQIFEDCLKLVLF